MKKISYVNAFAENFRQKKQYNRLLKEQHDIVLDPYISTDLVANSNWAATYLQKSTYTASKPVYKRKAVVFVIDTAAKITHPDVAPFVSNLYGKDFTGEGVQDGNGHGTGCASCYVGRINGVAPRSQTTIVPLKALKDNGSGSFSWVLNAMKYAYQTWRAIYPDHLAVISMSLGGGGGYKPLGDYAAELKKAGMWIAASSGNSGFSESDNRVGYPAKYDDVWAIGAIDRQGKVSTFSSGGDELVFTGPGTNVQIAWKDNSYINANGTSFGMPYAVAALLHMACQYPQLTTMDQALKYYAKYTTDLHRQGKDKATGYGVPILSQYIGQIPSNAPGETPPPPPPPEEEPEDENPLPPPTEIPRSQDRDLKFSLSNLGWSVVWSQQNYEGTQRVYIPQVNVTYTTKQSIEKAHDSIEKALNAFFNSRGIVLAIDRDYKTDEQLEQLIINSTVKSKNPKITFLPFQNQQHRKDFADAGYWVGRFIEIILRTRYDIDLKVISLTAKDDKNRTTTILI